MNDSEQRKLLETIEKIRQRANMIHRKDGAYDQTAEDIRKILRGG
jgi:hypothetical protein